MKRFLTKLVPIKLGHALVVAIITTALVVLAGVFTPVHAADAKPVAPRAAGTTACETEVSAPHNAWCDPMVTIGHRCVTDLNEDTLYNFERVGSRGIRCEADIRPIKETCRLVIHHDPTIGRVVDPASVPAGVSTNAYVKDLTLAQWRQLRTKHSTNPQPLATEWDWIKAAGENQWHTMLEVKGGFSTCQINGIKGYMNTFDPNYQYVSFWQEPSKNSNGTCNFTNIQKFVAAGFITGIKWPDGSSPCQMPSIASLANMGFDYVHGAQRSGNLATVVAQGDTYGIKVGVTGALTKSSWVNYTNQHVDWIMADIPFEMHTWFHTVL